MISRTRRSKKRITDSKDDSSNGSQMHSYGGNNESEGRTGGKKGGQNVEDVYEFVGTQTQKSNLDGAKHSKSAKDKKAQSSHALMSMNHDVSPLDQTSDFAGGCSPFKYTAAKALIKQHNVNKKKKTVGRSKRTARHVSTSEQTGSKKSEANDAMKDVQEIAKVENELNVEDEHSSKEVDLPQEEECSEDTETKKCKTCGSSVPKNVYSKHMSECLKSRFQRKSRTEETAVDVLFCQICQDDISKLSEAKRLEHYNSCLDKPQNEAEIQESENANQKASDVCLVCRKDIGHLNSMRKTQHINRCMDQDEENQRKHEDNQKALEAARNKVLDCPVCGQKLKTQNSRKTHVKKCAKQFGIPGNVMIERIRQQEQEYALQLEAGILPNIVKNTGGRKRQTRASKDSKDNDRLHAGGDTALAIALSNSMRDEEERRKRCSLDEFAIPAPLAETTSNVEPLPDVPVVDAFSLLMSPSKPKDVKSKRRRKNKEPEVTPVLLKQSALDAQDKLVKKVTEVMFTQSPQDLPCTPAFEKSYIHSKVMEANEANADEEKVWTKTSLKQQDDEMSHFYVNALMPPITPCKIIIGSKIKKMSAIPGWNPLPQDQDQSSQSPAKAVKTPQLFNKTVLDDTVLASTQTAVHLAELLDGTSIDKTMLNQTVIDKVTGGDLSMLPSPMKKKMDELLMNKTVVNVEIVPCKDTEENDMSGVEESVTASRLKSDRSVLTASTSRSKRGSLMDQSVFEEAASGFIVEDEDDQQRSLPSAITNLLSDLSGMVGNDASSDLALVVQGGDRLPVHSFILATRCPQMYKECKSQQEIDLSDYTKAAVMAVLQYLYSASTDIAHQLVHDVKNLSERFRLEELTQCCKKIIKRHNLEEDHHLHRCKNIDKTLQNILKDVWGSEEDDSDSETSSNNEAPEDDGDDLNGMLDSENVVNEVDAEVSDNEDVVNDVQSKKSVSFSPPESLSQKESHIDRLRTMSDQELLGIVQSQVPSAAIDPFMMEDGTEEFGDQTSDEGSECDSDDAVDSESDSICDNDNDAADDECEDESEREHVNDVLDEQENVALSPAYRSPVTNPSLSNSPELFTVQKKDGRSANISLPNTPSSSLGNKSGSDLFDSFYQSQSEKSNQRNRSPVHGAQTLDKSNSSAPSTPSPVFNTQASRFNNSQYPARNKVAINLLDTLNQEDGEVIMIEDEQDNECDNDVESAKDENENEEIDNGLDSRKRKRMSTSNSPLNFSQISLTSKRTRCDSPLHRSVFNAAKRSRDQSCQTPPSTQKRFPKLRRLCAESNRPLSKPDLTIESNDARNTWDNNDNSQNVSNVDGNHDEEPLLKKDESVLQKVNVTSYGKHNVSSDSDSDIVANDVESPDKVNDSQANIIEDVTNSPTDPPEEEVNLDPPAEEVNLRESINMEYDPFDGMDEPEPFYEDYNYGASLSPSVKSPKKILSLTTRISSGTDEGNLELPDLNTDMLDNQVEEKDVVETVVVDDSSNDSVKERGGGDMTHMTEKNDIERDAGGDGVSSSAAISKGVKKFQFRSAKSSTQSDTQKDVPEGEMNTVERSPEQATSCQAGVTQTPLLQETTKGTQGGTDVGFESDGEDDGVLNMYMDAMENQEEEEEEFDPPTDVSTMDASLLDSEHPNLMKTPAIPKKKRKPIKEWIPPSPFTPMPNYDTMPTPQLKKQCSKYGVRALPKKKMKGVLMDIYHKAHQYETDSEYEPGTPAHPKPSQPLPPPPTQPAPAKTKTAGRKGKAGAGKGKSSKAPPNAAAEMSGEAKSGGQSRVAGVNSESDAVSDVLNSSFEEKDGGDLPEESFMCSQQASPISKRDLAYKRKQVWDYIQSHEDLCLKILHYEPLEFDEFHQQLKTSGISLGKQVLMDFLDDKCIQFSLRGSRKPARKRSPRKRRGGGSPRKRGRGRGRGASQTNSVALD